MKRLSIALAAIGLSAGAFAALPAATDPTLVAVPQLPGGFVIGGTALYLQPSDSNGDLDYASVNSGTTSTFNSTLKNIEPGYDWGWGANIGYIFPNTGNDINLSYFKFDNNDDASTGVNTAVGNINEIYINHRGNAITKATSKVDYDLDQINLTAGQFIDVGCRLILHPNVGLSWARLDRKINTSYVQPSTTTTDYDGSTNIHEKSDFSGIGPIVGLDASYYIGMGVGAVAHIDSALLVGSVDSDENTTFAENSPKTATQEVITDSFKADKGRRIVPAVDTKLGIDYTYVFNNAANSDLTLEAGWQFSNYFNAVDKLAVSGASSSSPGSITGRRTSDIALQGPYVSLVFHA